MRNFLSDFIHKESLKLRVKVQFRFINKKTVIACCIIKIYKQGNYFSQTMAFSIFKHVFYIPCSIFNNRNQGSINIFYKFNGFSKHTGKNLFNFCPDFFISFKNLNLVAVVSVSFKKFYRIPRRFKLLRNFLSK